MLDLMRRQAGSWMIKFVLGAIIIVFAFWGVGTFNARRLAKLATVNDTIITFEQYRDAYNRLLEQMRERFGGRLDDEMLKALDLKRQAVDQLVSNELLIQEAERLGMRVTDEELARAIRSVEVFQRNGRFDTDRYRRVLGANRTTPEAFEFEQRQAMLIGKLRAMVADTVKVADAEARAWYDYANARVAVDFVRFDPESFTDAAVSDAEVQSYYDAHKEDYRTAPRRRARYLFFDPDNYLDKVSVADDEIREYYDSHLDEFHRQASVEARHVLIRTTEEDTPEAVAAARQRAEEVMRKARDGEDFAELARTYSEGPSAPKGGYLGSFQRGDMVAPFADAAFAMAPGEISEPVKTQFGWHVIKVEGKQPESTRSLEDARAEIREKLASGKAKGLAYDAAEATWEAAYDANDLEPVARLRGLTLLDTGLFDRKGPAGAPISDKTGFAEAAFEPAVGDVGDVVEIDGGYAVIEPVDAVPARVPELAEIAGEVREDALRERRSEMAREAAEAMLDAVRGGEDFAAAAAARDGEVRQTGLFGRQGFIDKIGVAQELAEAAFDLSAERPLPDKVFKVDRGWYVVRFARRQMPGEEGFGDQQDRIVAQLRQQKQFEAFDELLARLRAASEVEIKEEMLN